MTGSEREPVADVAVVGSGAGGAVAAAELQLGGVDTMLLEEGPHHDPASFDQREATMMPRLYAEGGQRFTRDQSLLILSGRGLGGSTVHNTALCVPPPRPILEAWAAAGALPVRPAEVEAAADAVLERIGARPPEPEHVNPANRLLEEGARRIGLATVRPLTSRTACSGCGYCVLGCRYNRKRHVLFSHLEPAVGAGLRIVTGARVGRVRRRGDGFELLGPGLRARCRRVVVAASALGTPVLLQRSGLGPARRVGRGLRLHPFAPVVGVYDEPVDAHRGIPQSVLVTGGARFLEGGRGGFVLMGGAAGPGGTASLLPETVPAAQLMRGYRHLGMAGVLLHDELSGRVRARRDGLPSVSYWPRGEDATGLLEGVRACARVHFAAGARRVLLPFRTLPEASSEADLRGLARVPLRRHDAVLTSVHPQGTVPLGGDARLAAARPDGGLFGAPGVYVADASLFPTSVGVPPQVTVMALATLVARGLVAELS